MGRKRSIATYALGLRAVVVCAASTADNNNAGIRVLNQAKAIHSTITKVWVNQGFNNRPVEYAARSASTPKSSPDTPRPEACICSDAGG